MLLLNSFSCDFYFWYVLEFVRVREKLMYPATWSLEIHALHSSTTLYPRDLVHASVPVNGTHIFMIPTAMN